MKIEIIKEDKSILGDYFKIPISFQVNSIFDLSIDNSVPPQISLVEKTVEPWIKNYDEADDSPILGNENWDISNWGIFRAFSEEKAIGGMACAWDTKNVWRLEDRKDICVLWDLRVHPDYRKQGIGKMLFEKAIDFATDRGCRCLKVETQNINVPACKFYQKQGCQLGSFNRYAYWELPDEVLLDWYYFLDSK